MPRELFRARVLFPTVVLSAVALWASWKILQALERRKQKFRLRCFKDRQIYVINTAEEWETVWSQLKQRCEKIKAVGFDCEWVFWGERLPVALIQIATYDGLCLLVRIYQMSDDIPASLRKFLNDKSILKIGVSCKDDGKKLFKDYGLSVNGCVDLRHILGRIRGYQCTHQGLQGLAKVILGVTMTKDRRIRCGDWEAETLSEEQMNYAADDAIYAIDMFMQLVAVKSYGVNRNSSYHGNTVSGEEETFWRSARSLCQGVVDVGFKSTKSSAAAAAATEEDVIQPQQSTSNNIAIKPGKQKESYKAYMTRKRPLYYNCRLLAPDGKCLTQCDIRKANWYVDKGLGVKVSEDPVTVQLKFEPTKRMPRSEYRLQERQNMCTVCGSENDLIRRVIVPLEYRKHFPPNFQDHIAHDVLLMCLACHHKSAVYETALRQRLARQCDAPIQDSSLANKPQGDMSLQAVVSAAKALQSKKNKLPDARRTELEAVVKSYYGVTVVTDDILTQAREVDYRFRKHDHIPHGKKVMEYYQQEGGLMKFIMMWRQQFIDTMEPKHLPSFWSIDHNPEDLWKKRQLDNESD